MADKEARIRISLDNAAQTISDLLKIRGGFKGLGDMLQGVKKLAGEASSAIANIKPFKPVEATNAAASYRDQITRLSIAMTGNAKAVDYLQARFEKIGEQIKMSAPEVANLALEYGRATYDIKGAVGSIEDLGRMANNLGRPLEDLTHIGADLHNHLGVPMNDVVATMIRFKEIAQNTATVGGGAALLQTIRSLGGALEKFDTKTDKSRERLAAFVALVGKGLPQQQASEAAAGALGWISGDALGLGRYLGRKTLIHGGKIDDPIGILQAIKKKIGATRDRAAALRVLANYTSPAAAENLASLSELATDDALFGATEAATARKAGLQGVGAYDLNNLTPEQRARIQERLRLQVGDSYGGTAAGELKGADVETENVQRRLGGTLLKARDAYQRGYKGNREGQLADETVIDLLPGAMSGAVQAYQAADAYDASRTPQGPSAAEQRTQQLLQQQVTEIRKTNEILKTRVADPNSTDVRRRKSATND